MIHLSNKRPLRPCEELSQFPEIRLYIKHHFRHPLVTQSVAMVYTTDGLEEEVSTLTVFTNIAREIVFLSNTPVRVFYSTDPGGEVTNPLMG